MRATCCKHVDTLTRGSEECICDGDVSCHATECLLCALDSASKLMHPDSNPEKDETRDAVLVH